MYRRMSQNDEQTNSHQTEAAMCGGIFGAIEMVPVFQLKKLL